MSEADNPYDFLYVLLWSRTQGAMHVETLAETAADAHDALMSRRDAHDWITLNVGPEGFIRGQYEALRPVVIARHEADVSLGLIEP